jgi:tRNA nucleotidyltransferase (CCA-adding enzyme)
MTTNTFQALPSVVLQLANACRKADGRALLVGGCVRDELMGLPCKDLDIEVYHLSANELVRILKTFGPVNEVGRSFGVYKLKHGKLEIDISIPRRDSNVGPGHRGIEVVGDPNMSVEEASRRRDLTVNAIMYDPIDKTLLDPQGGLDDLRKGILCPVDENTFLEDPLRAIRAVQFAARLGFEASPALKTLCQIAALDELPPERIQGEWQKLLLKANQPSIGFQLARDTEIISRVFPEAYHYDHLLNDEALDRIAKGPRDQLSDGQSWALMLGVWLHRSPKDTIETTLDRLWLHKWTGYRLRERTIQLVAQWQHPIKTDSDLRHMSTRCEIEITLLARWALTQDDEALRRLERARELNIANNKPAALLLGRHLAELGISPGPHMGVVLQKVYQQQLDGAVTTLAEAKVKAAEHWDSTSS